MSITNFKIKEGINIGGLVLNSSNGTLTWDGANIATQSYVDTAIGNISIPPAYITSVDTIFSVDGSGKLSINLSDYATQSYVGNQGFITSSALTDYATKTYVGDQGYITSSALSGYALTTDIPSLTNYVTLDGTETLSNKTFKNGLYVADLLDTATHHIFGSLNGDLHISAGGNIELSPISPTGIVTINGSEVATKSYVDATAQGLDVKQSVAVASTENINLGTFSYGADAIDGTYYSGGTWRVLLKDQTNTAENGIYIPDSLGSGLVRAADATVGMGATLTKGAFTFVEGGTSAGKGFVVSDLTQPDSGGAGGSVTWTQFSETGNYITSVGSHLTVTDGQLTVDLSGKQNVLTAGTGISIVGDTISVTSAPQYITAVDASFSVTDGTLALSDTITISSVSLTDTQTNVAASSDVFGNASTSTYTKGVAQQVYTIPTGTVAADLFLQIVDTNGDSRTSKLTAVFNGGSAPIWTEYGIIDSGTAMTAAVSVSGSGLYVQVDGSGTYAVRGVVTNIA